MRHLADLPEVTRSRIQTWIDGGRVRINGTTPAKPASRVALDDQVEIVLPPPPPRRRPQPQEMPLSVLYEDEHLLALDKPPGLVAHPAPGHREGTLINALLWRAQEWGEGSRPGLVSRLDRDTSGVLLVAKTPAAHGALARALRQRRTEKDYLAVVYGTAPFDRGRIDLRIDRDPEDRRRRIASKTEGRESVTLYERLDEAAGLTLLRCRLATGRTHQIRVHLQATGLPIVGDPLYGELRWKGRFKGVTDPDLAARCREFPRQALHARRLAFVHPATGAALEIVAPVPADLAGLLAAAGLDPGE